MRLKPTRILFYLPKHSVRVLIIAAFVELGCLFAQPRPAVRVPVIVAAYVRRRLLAGNPRQGGSDVVGPVSPGPSRRRGGLT